ncbi:MAG TPA: hypothetical protein VGF26_29810, partial [Ramlibacter sp.]
GVEREQPARMDADLLVRDDLQFPGAGAIPPACADTGPHARSDTGAFTGTQLQQRVGLEWHHALHAGRPRAAQRRAV